MIVEPAVAGAVVVAGAAVLDHVVGEPPDRYHPVAWFGTVVAWIDRRWTPPYPRLVGIGIAVLLPVLAGILGWILVELGSMVHPVGGLVLAIGGLSVATSRRALISLADAVITASETDPATAKQLLPGLVGRDPAPLEPWQLRSAAIESAAENLADGLVGPLLAFVVLAPVSLSLGVAGAMWVKGVNTLDSMLGYPDRKIGIASARLDDGVMWLPARVTALGLAIGAGRPKALLAARRFARQTASPNAGWPMGTMAVILGVTLEKPGTYRFEAGDRPTVDDGLLGVRIVDRVGAGCYVLAIALGIGWWLGI